ncbi:nucleoside/nucleotide kinase family protein [Chitinophaga japonensis]|uniref:ATPase family protein associated with various cellular activities (AAA) n=1 Tax=Chitinophaga japonensis TaxID=104662 RepID=A0A562T085_CHIJA|nr:ATPase [Chitinophaga japonensis]TWI86674.1 hypothetical protein LX66_3937 [Chitinophaga japonensis]
METPYDYPRLLKMVVRRGRQLYGPAFHIAEEDSPVLRRLLCWFLQDEAVAKGEGICLHKGILLAGPVGCGKSAIMRVFQSLCDKALQFAIKPCTAVELEFAAEGYDVIHRYAHRSLYRYGCPRAVCFDDLGFESNVNYFGNNYNVMLKILAHRYELLVEQGLVTHATTNLDSAEMEARYGSRLRSRMRQMFNLVAFPHTSRDKRI